MSNQLCEYLVRDGIITQAQVAEALRMQEKRTRPIGAILEEQFGVHPRDIERAWAEQYADLAAETTASSLDPAKNAIDLVTARQAWQFGILPVSYENGKLVACTSRKHLPRAIRFATKRLKAECEVLLATESELGRALHHHYPMPGLGPEENGFANLEYDFADNVFPVEEPTLGAE
ncbi:MAG: hypothetical protein H6815_06805 [Phycisphaeraceae bacterium]|nr:hypothetical protein [Phycisphaerales bacterium]MCB9860148.1 hypothetical protein [Phycisphaeraceae bacterium]